MSSICEEDFPVILMLAPDKSKTVDLTPMIEETIEYSKVSFKIGLNFLTANRPRQEFNIKEFS